nr:MAG TPA: hypothetical protein [Caudoviricetes sp.]
MQVPYAFMEIDGKWTDITAHTGDVCALAGFEIEWGANTALSQPEPSVLDITLIDHDGRLAGRSLSLLGARIMIYLSAPPTWDDITELGTWVDNDDVTIADLHTKYRPLDTRQPDPLTPCMFVGRVSSGGTVTPYRDGWKIELSASSQLLDWKRLQSQGPTSGDAKYKGLHWVGTPTQRLEEMNSRARTAGAPTANIGDLAYPPSCAPYAGSDNVSQYDLLHRLFAHSHLLPMWYETPRWTRPTIDPLDLTTPCLITADTDGTMVASRNGTTGICLDSGDVIVGAALSIPEPVTQVKITTRKTTVDVDGVLGVDDASVIHQSTGLPDNLTQQQNSLTCESDAVTDDQSRGAWGQGTYTPTTTQRDQVSAWITALDTRLTPGNITVCALNIDPAIRPELYRCTPPPPLTFADNRFHTLAGSDGRPSFSGPWQAIGGIITFEWRDERPVLRHEMNLISLPIDETNQLAWDDLDGWTASWHQVGFSWAEMGIISTITKTKQQEES